MKRLDSLPISLTDSSTTLRQAQHGGSGRRPKPGGRLIVLVPSPEADLSIATHRIWELSSAGSGCVLLLGLYENPAQELSLRRQLAGMSAILGSAGIYTEIETEFGNDWTAAVRSRVQTGEMVVCFAEHRIGRMNRSLSQILQANLNVPLYILSGPNFQEASRSDRWSLIFAWAGFIAIIVGFFLVQIRLHQLTSGSIRTLLVLVSVGLEFWMISVWNGLFK
jgi:hypothetical protein